MTLPAFAAERRAAAQLLLGARRPQLSIDISCSHDAQQQTRRIPLLRSNDGTVDGPIDGQTHSRTDGHIPNGVSTSSTVMPSKYTVLYVEFNEKLRW